MQQTTQQSGVTFAVDDVRPATELLPESRMHETVKRTLGGIESCSDYHATVIDDIRYQPLLAAVYTAFSQHRPLVLTPDAVWLTIAQGVAHHMTIHGERLRSRFVAHQGKLNLVFESRGWVDGSPENPWAEAFTGWAEKIRDHLGSDIHDALVCDFSTTGPVERAASQVVLMDVFERYFHYVMYGICGIPAVTLEGTPDDWQRLADKASALAVFDLDWWLPHLLPICAHFVRASRGDVDLEHWQGICKLRSAYGGNIINGWIAKLFPYLRAFIYGPCNRRNPIFETGEGCTTLIAPPGLSRVPFTWRNAETGHERLMEAVGGLLGVTQDHETLALRPKIGWAVRAAGKFDVLLARVTAEHKAYPRVGEKRSVGSPADLANFYHRLDGVELFGVGATAACRIVAASDIEPLDWGEVPDPNVGNTRGPGGRTWFRFAWLADRTWLAVNLDLNVRSCLRHGSALKERAYQLDESFAPICHGSAQSQGREGQNPVVALSFTEFLEKMLDGGGRPYWLDPDFQSYGDAEQFTRRD